MISSQINKADFYKSFVVHYLIDSILEFGRDLTVGFQEELHIPENPCEHPRTLAKIPRILEKTLKDVTKHPSRDISKKLIAPFQKYCPIINPILTLDLFRN